MSRIARGAARKPTISTLRREIAPKLTGEDLAELLATAEFQTMGKVGGAITWNGQHKTGGWARLIDLGLTQATRPPELNLTPNSRCITLTRLGWLVLLDRAREALAPVLPPEEPVDAE